MRTLRLWTMGGHTISSAPLGDEDQESFRVALESRARETVTVPMTPWGDTATVLMARIEAYAFVEQMVEAGCVL